MRKTAIFFLLAFVFLFPLISAAEINDTLHVNIQSTFANNSIQAGTFEFAFNITENGDSACLGPIVYNHSEIRETDSRGRISIYLPQTGSGGGNLSQLSFDKQYYICYSRNGTLNDVAQFSPVPYSFRATEINLSEVSVDSNLTLGNFNVSASSGFFSFLGSLVNRITNIFATDANISNNLTIGGNLSVNGTTLFVNANTGRIGINTTTPQNTLNVVGTGNITSNFSVDNNVLFIDTDNNRVGIGTTAPGAPLDVNGSMRLADDATLQWGSTGLQPKIVDAGNAELRLYAHGDLSANIILTGNAPIFFNSSAADGSNAFGYVFDTAISLTNPTAKLVSFRNKAVEKAYIDKNGGASFAGDLIINASDLFVNSSSGNVGINTTTPQNTLNVVGDLNVTGTIYGAGSSNITDTYVPYTGAFKNVDLGNNNFTINGTTFLVNTNTGHVGIGTTPVTTHTLRIGGGAGGQPIYIGINDLGSSVIAGGGTLNLMSNIASSPSRLTLASGSLNLLSTGDTNRKVWSFVESGGAPQSNYITSAAYTGFNNVNYIKISSEAALANSTTTYGRLVLNTYNTNGSTYSGTVQEGIRIDSGSDQARVAIGGAIVPGIRLTVNGSLLVNNTFGSALLLANATSGNVGINTTTPGITLDVQGPSAGSVGGNTGGGLRIKGGATNDGLTIGTDSTNRFSWVRAFRTGTGENNLSLQPQGGNVGIGTESPTQTLHVVGNVLSAASSSSGAFYLANTNHGLRRLSGTNNIELFTTNGNISFSASAVGSNQVTLLSSGNVGINTTTPQNTLNVVGTGNITSNFSVDNNVLFVNSNINMVGIGTTSPSNTLDVVTDGNPDRGITLTGSNSPVIKFANSTGTVFGRICFADSATNCDLDSLKNDIVFRSETSNIRFTTNAGGSTAMLINATSGRIGIGSGITDPSQTLVVRGTANFTTSSDSTTAFRFFNSTGFAVLNIDTTNERVGIGTTAPQNKLNVVGAGNFTQNSFFGQNVTVQECIIFGSGGSICSA